jgi:ACR3 family arsenite transporter
VTSAGPRRLAVRQLAREAVLDGILGWLGIRCLFAPMLPTDPVDSYTAGVMLLVAAPCTAMIFERSRLSNGDPLFTLSQVVLNDTIMIFSVAPIAGFLYGISSLVVPWGTLVTAVVLYIVVPVMLPQIWRRCLLARGPEARRRALDKVAP